MYYQRLTEILHLLLHLLNGRASEFNIQYSVSQCFIHYMSSSGLEIQTLWFQISPNPPNFQFVFKRTECKNVNCFQRTLLVGLYDDHVSPVSL